MLSKIFSIILVSILITGCSSVATNAPVVQKGPEKTTSPNAIIRPPAATPTNDPILSLDNLTTTLPNDIIQEISYFGGMGGSGNCSQSNYKKPTFYYTPNPEEVMHSFYFSICGLKIDEKEVHVQVELPDKTEREFNINTRATSGQNYKETSFSYTPDYHDPKGIYHFVFSGKKWSLDYSVEVKDADSPRLYYLFDEKKIILYKFQPNDNVRVFVYDRYHGNLIGWKKYQVDGKGELEFPVDVWADFSAVGDKSGQAFELGWPGGDVSCPGAPSPIGVHVGLPYGYVRVLVDHLPYFDEEGHEKGTLSQGDSVQVQSNAICKNAAWWWKVDVRDGSTTYYLIQEGNAQQPFILPLTGIPPTPTFDPAKIPACPGTKPTRLQPGMNAEVTRSGKAPQLSLRAQPNMSAEKIHTIAAGRHMVILEGPVCANHAYWWRIRSEQGFEGWAREGDNEDYWIDPLP